MTKALAALLTCVIALQAPVMTMAAENTAGEEILAEEEVLEGTAAAEADALLDEAEVPAEEEAEEAEPAREEAAEEAAEPEEAEEEEPAADSQGDSAEVLEEAEEEESLEEYEAALGSGTLSTDLAWTVSSEGALTFTKSGTGTWEIPSFTKENSPWYSIRTRIKTVTLPDTDGVTLKIGNYAFYGLTALTDIAVPDNVSSIGTGAFQGCTALGTCAWNTDAALPESVFQGCTALTDFDSYAEIASIGRNAFNGCSALTELDFLSLSMKSIGDSAFAGCSKLARICLSSKLDSVGSSVFVNQASLTVLIPSQFQNEAVFTKMKSAYSKVKWGINFEGSYPLLTSVSPTLKGLKIKWKHLDTATEYILYRKPKGGSDEEWTIIGEMNSVSDKTAGATLSYTDTGTASGKAYTYTVQGYQEAGDLLTACNVSGDLASSWFYTAPADPKVSNTAGGAKISWTAVSGIDSYRVYGKAGNGEYEELADVKGTSYTWKNAKSNVSYTYTVRCLKDGKLVSSYNAGTSKVFYEAPAAKCTRKADSIKVSWKSVSGIDSYRVYYRIGKGEWTKLTDVKGTSYTWKKAVSGKDYFFTVRCLKDGKQVSSYQSGTECLYYAAPSVKAANAADGVKVTWNTSGGVDAYRVYYKTEKGEWKVLKDVKGSSYTWKGAKQGKLYEFTVRCVKGGKQVSSYRTGASVRFYPAVNVSSVKKVSGGIKISWKNIKVKKYRVYVKTGSGSYKKLADVSGTSYTWKKAKNNTKYTFIVKVVSKDGKTVYSAPGTSKSITYKK